MFTKNSVTDNDGAGFKSVLRTTLNVHICSSMTLSFVVTNISPTSLLRRMTLAGHSNVSKPLWKSQSVLK